MMTNTNTAYNADPKELAKFSDIAHRWWDPKGDFAPLHQINPLRLNWIDQLANLQGKKILDVGCGGGILAESMAVRGGNVLGIDLAEKALKVAQLHALTSEVASLSYELIAAESLAQTHAAQFDVITCMEMLEHVPNPASIVNACCTLAKPGAWIFFSTINRNIKSFLMAIVAAEYVLKLLPKGTHEYDRLIQPAELARWVRQADLHVHEMKGMQYNPLTKRYWLSEDTGVNYMLACRKPS